MAAVYFDLSAEYINTTAGYSVFMLGSKAYRMMYRIREWDYVTM